MTHESEEYPLYDSLDNAILMHRDVHFGGKFEFMIDYYEKEGKGTNPDFSLTRIRELDLLEKELEQNLAATLLSGPEIEQVAAAKEAYRKLRALYDPKQNQSDETLKYPRLLADLILSEEEEPAQEIAAIVAEKSAIVPSLLKLLQSEDYYDPLFPGYGFTPTLATECLGLIGDKRAIVSLFESIGDHDFTQETLALEALKRMGTPAKQFLIHVLRAKPITYDNERAAIALLPFNNDEEVVQICFTMLKELDLKTHPLLSTHLALICEGLQDPKQRKEFEELSKQAPSMLKQDMLTVAAHWKS